jgi:hypothetical protein
MREMNFWQRFHPQYWTSKHYVITASLLLAINLFGPKGLVHWVLVNQESARLENEKTRLQDDIDRVKLEIKRFRSSDVAKARAIREQLGFIQPGELSLEILDTPEDATLKGTVGKDARSW